MTETHDTGPPEYAASTAEIFAKAELFVSLVGATQRKLFLYILSLVANPADAEDILQETNLVLWRKFSEFRPGSDFLSWACKVAYYEVLKHRSRTERLKTGLSDGIIEILAEDAQAALQEADLRREALAKCLSRLREPVRQMIQLRYQVQASVEQVAKQVGKSVEAVRRALHRARSALLQCIERELAKVAR